MSQDEYTIVIEVKKKYVEARTSGVRTFDSVKAITLEIFDAALTAHRSKILIDVRELKGQLGVLESYRIVTEVFNNLRGKGISTAAIVDQQIPQPRSWFLQTVAQNRGFNLRIFPQQDEARQWLEL